MNEAVLVNLGTVSEETKGPDGGSLFECVKGTAEWNEFIPC